MNKYAFQKSRKKVLNFEISFQLRLNCLFIENIIKTMCICTWINSQKFIRCKSCCYFNSIIFLCYIILCHEKSLPMQLFKQKSFLFINHSSCNIKKNYRGFIFIITYASHSLNPALDIVLVFYTLNCLSCLTQTYRAQNAA
jgi:hypothetical protein